MISRRLVLLAFPALALGGCATAAPRAGADATGSGGSGPGDRILEDYRLGSGDKVRVNVFGEQALTGEFQVSGGGMISLPLIGDMRAAGLTVAEFQRSVEEGLKQGYLLDPKVSAEVLTYRPFFVLGEVGSPGTYPYTNGLTVLNAVATAGGFTYRADTKRVYIRRAGGGDEEVYQLTTSTAVAPGDTIRIGERFF
jgi:polysaccharide export outer membrane protein